MAELEHIIKKIENFIKNYKQQKPKKHELPFFVRCQSLLTPVRKILGKLNMGNLEVRTTTDGLLVGDIFVGVQSKRVFEVLYSITTLKDPKNVEGYSTRTKRAIIKEGPLERVISTIGHELGHLFTPTIPDKMSEEAKAFAFEYAWCKAIQDYNILSLSLGRRELLTEISTKSLNKKKHSAHHRALRSVLALIESGYNPLQLYWKIANGKVNLQPLLLTYHSKIQGVS